MLVRFDRVVFALALSAIAAPAFATTQVQAPPANSPAAPAVSAPAPRRLARTIGDALLVIPDVTGRIARVGDTDGDGSDELVLERGGRHGAPAKIDLVSSRAGKLVRTLWSGPVPTTWDAGGDVDADRVPDLLMSFLHDDDPGRIVVVSGRTGETRMDWKGAAVAEGLGTALAFAGDQDGDGRDDFAVGAPEVPSRFPLYDRKVASYRSSTSSTGSTHSLVFEDGSAVDHRRYLQERLRARSTSAGYVSMRSGKDGSELWRVQGFVPGHAFGTLVRAVGDLDRDGVTDLLCGCDQRSREPLRVLSGKTRAPILTLPTRHGPAAGCGDLDGDGVPDLALDAICIDSDDRFGGVQLASGRTGKPLGELPYPDMLSPYGVTVALGDLDGDGCADLGLGEPNFNLTAPGSPGHPSAERVQLAGMSLEAATNLESNPWCAFTWESGCALVHSGRTREVIFGVWAPPGSREGLGLALCAVADVSGDGAPDVLVTDASHAYVFAGPGFVPRK